MRVLDSKPRVVLIRHGETEWTVLGRYTSRADIALSDTGRRQAQQLAARLPQSFALVVTSPLARAHDTCRLAGLAAHAVASEDLTEWDYGSYEGLTTVEIRAERPEDRARGAAEHLLVELGELAAERRRPVPEHGDEVGQRRTHAQRRLEEHEGAFVACDGLEAA